MKDIIKNIAAILLYVWAIPFQITILIILSIGGIPIMLCGTKILSFNKYQKLWQLTKFFENVSSRLEATNIFN